MQELETRDRRYEHEHSVDWVVGAFLIARRDAVDAVGLMDERFFLYSEEADWCYRFREAGWDVRHLPLMTIIHHAGRRDRGDLMAQLAQSRKLFAHKHFSKLRSLQIRGALALGHLLRLVLLLPRTAHREAARTRLRAESRALGVQLGLREPPYLGQPPCRGPLDVPSAERLEASG
jgi:GT2 family glycosyltransferase